MVRDEKKVKFMRCYISLCLLRCLLHGKRSFPSELCIAAQLPVKFEACRIDYTRFFNYIPSNKYFSIIDTFLNNTRWVSAMKSSCQCFRWQPAHMYRPAIREEVTCLEAPQFL